MKHLPAYWRASPAHGSGDADVWEFVLHLNGTEDEVGELLGELLVVGGHGETIA